MIATWLVAVLAADLRRRGGYRGPAASLLRRLVGPVRPRSRTSASAAP